MAESDELEQRVREALRIDAEAGPDYASTIHARVMALAAANPHTRPVRHNAHRMMMMVTMIACLMLLSFIIFQITR